MDQKSIPVPLPWDQEIEQGIIKQEEISRRSVQYTLFLVFYIILFMIITIWAVQRYPYQEARLSTVIFGGVMWIVLGGLLSWYLWVYYGSRNWGIAILVFFILLYPVLYWAALEQYKEQAENFKMRFLR